jgi:RHS repeat-associated protein
VPCYGQTDTTLKFTGQERDAENGLDNFLARHLAGAQGRFLSPDPAGNFVADMGNPQSWNLYSYVWNNPLVYIDPTGLWVQQNPGSGDSGGDGSQDQNLFWTYFDLATLPLTFTQQQAEKFVQHVTNYISAPISQFRNSAGCTNAVVTGLTVAGAVIGNQVGAQSAAGLAVETGPGMVPAAAAGGISGGIVGGAAGHLAGTAVAGVICSSSAKQGGGSDSGGSGGRSTAGNMQKQVERGQAPRSVDRVDRARFPYEKDQLRFKDGSALNYDGTWKHGGRALTNIEAAWLTENG